MKKKYIQPKIAKIEMAEEINSIDAEFEESEYPMSFDEEVKSLGQLQLERCHEKKEILVKHIDPSKNGLITLENIKYLFEKKKYDKLIQYKFPYMNLSEFNCKKYQIDLKKLEAFFLLPAVRRSLKTLFSRLSYFYNSFQT